MVGAPAAADAVARGRRMPQLGVGLHLVLVDGTPLLPTSQVPDLIGRDGRFRSNMALAGINFLRPHVRRQLAAEIEAQFAAFNATGLPLDHVNAHRHFHLHPTIASIIIQMGPRFGMRAVRAPVEPAPVLARVEPTPTPLSAHLATRYARRLSLRLRRAGIQTPDAVFGLRWTGHLTRARLLALIPMLPPGIVEVYAHPATRDTFPGHAPTATHRAELAALTDPEVVAAVSASGRRLARFSDA